jgi:ABC-type sugar transport system ATPase subunit
VYRRDGGEILIDGRPADIHTTLEARRYGIETVYQDEGLIPLYNAAKNLFLGRPKVRDSVLGRLFRLADYRYMRGEADALLKRIGIELPNSNAAVVNLSGGQRQSVLVGKAIYWGGRILVFDEPTNHLGAKQERNIMNLIKRIRDQYDVAIIVISHNIAHVFELADRIIVLRNGQLVGEKKRNETNPNEIVSMITGLSA